ncbi:MAG TPA: MarR family transcriptional regulator [Mycobacterium sp.]|nr:MarR family transcriptional regulator [Mycobacterium sp.]
MAHKNAVQPRTAEEHRVIRAFHTAFMTMMRQFDADLQREHRLSHTEYVAMDFLVEAPDRTLGLSDLAARCQQSLSAISRAVGRLEAQGLVRREQSTRDARAYNAVLTDAGLQRYNEATPTHNTSLRRYLFDQLEGIDLEAFGDALQRISAAADHRTTVPSPTS